MATTTSGGGDFTSNLGRIYGIYTGGFIAFIILMAILSAMGVPNRIIGYMFVGFTILIYAVIGILSRTMQVGDEALFYHSNIGLAVVGIMKIVKTAYPDPTDSTGKFVMVDVTPVKALPQPLPLKIMKADEILSGMAMVKQSRLSVSLVTQREWQRVLELAGL